MSEVRTGRPRVHPVGTTSTDRSRISRRKAVERKWQEVEAMNLKTLLNHELDKIKPDVEREVDLAIQDLTTRIALKTPDTVKQWLTGRIESVHGNPLITGVLTLAVSTFDFAPYVAHGVVQGDKLRAEIKKRIEGARF